MVIVKGQQGKLLERHIDITNRIYKEKGVADIRKVPTPVQITKRLKFGQVQGRLEKPQWVDYVGIYKGKAIAFEAKETNVKTRFDLSNIADHQIELLKSYRYNGGISFVLISFLQHNEVYLLTTHMLTQYINEGKKSIPYSDFKAFHIKINSNYEIPLDYLRHLDL